MRRIRNLFILLAAVVAALPLAAQPAENLRQLQKLIQVYRYLSGLYVDQVEMGPLVEEAIEGMLGELDPHSSYIDAEAMRGVQEQFNGEFSGIGVEFNVLRDSVVVANTVAGGPAERVGIRANDRIVRIDTLRAVGLRRADVPKYLRGERGTKVAVDVVRPATCERLHFEITRERIPLHTVDAAYMAADGIGYIKVNRFGRTTMEEFSSGYRALGRPGSLILDLRGNSGGLLEQAVGMAGFFLPQGAVIVTTEGRAVPSQRFEAPHDGENLTGRVVVLIDEVSASASEIVAGALQDWDRGVVVGRPSFGKGLVQRQIALSDGSALRLTVARYHTPSGRVIQRPYERGDRRGYYLDHLRRHDGAVCDSLEALSPVYRTLRSGRTVRGGGGIRPDVIVGVDTAGYSDYYGALLRRGVVQEFANEWLDRARDSLAALYPAFEAFDAGFTPSEGLLGALAAFGERCSVPRDDAGLAASRELMRTQLKALAAGRLYGTGAFYRVVNARMDTAYARAVALLGAWETQGEPLLAPSGAE